MAIWFITRDWCGLACFLFGIGVTWFTDYVMVAHVILPWMGWTVRGLLHIAALQSLVALAFISHIRCACTNPGTLLKNVVRRFAALTCRLAVGRTGPRSRQSPRLGDPQLEEETLQRYRYYEDHYGRGIVPARVCRCARQAPCRRPPHLTPPGPPPPRAVVARASSPSGRITAASAAPACCAWTTIARAWPRPRPRDPGRRPSPAARTLARRPALSTRGGGGAAQLGQQLRRSRQPKVLRPLPPLRVARRGGRSHPFCAALRNLLARGRCGAAWPPGARGRPRLTRGRMWPPSSVHAAAQPGPAHPHHRRIHALAILHRLRHRHALRPGA